MNDCMLAEVLSVRIWLCPLILLLLIPRLKSRLFSGVLDLERLEEEF